MDLDPNHYSASSLPLLEWPIAHQNAWYRSFEKSGLFVKPNNARKWRTSSINKTQKGYGVWLNWNMTRSGLTPDDIANSAAEDCVTRPQVEAYVDDLINSSSSMTVYNRVQELYDTIVNITPHLPKAHWGWLKSAWQYLRNDAVPVRNKFLRLKEADQLEALGLKLMQEAEASPNRNYRRREGLTAINRALKYRNGLIIALLIRRPFRIKNFYSLSMGKNFLMDGTEVGFSFQAVEMKGKRSMSVPFPVKLLPHLKRYIDHYRPILLTTSMKAKGNLIDALWVSRYGSALTESPLRKAVYNCTEQEFGCRIPPHWFRDSAVTTLIRDKPESAKITGLILGHADHSMVQKHYNQSQMIYASRRHYQIICDLISEAEANPIT